MAYCSLDQLVARYSERMLLDVSDRAGVPAEAIDVGLVDRAIADADALIDGHLKARYALPLAEVPRLVTDLSLRISIYYAHAHVAAEKIRADYEAALKTLRDIASGLIRLDVEGSEPAAGGDGEVRFNMPERPLSAASLKGYI
jgi:phage gp36-like protein